MFFDILDNKKLPHIATVFKQLIIPISDTRRDLCLPQSPRG